MAIGVDTHVRNHSDAILPTAIGELIATKGFPTAPAGLNRTLSWASGLAGGDLAELLAIEGAATFGAQLARTVTDAGHEVAEAAPINAGAHRHVRKCDPLDAHRIATAVLPLENDRLRRPHTDEKLGPALRVLTTVHGHMSRERTAYVNVLTALEGVSPIPADSGNTTRHRLNRGGDQRLNRALYMATET